MTEIIITNEDLFKIKASTIVIPVNTVGVMGAGIAKIAKQKNPIMFESYRSMCFYGDLAPGDYVYELSDDGMQKLILFPTKEHWKNPSKLEWIESGLQSMIDARSIVEKHGITLNFMDSIAFPKIGCGLGGLNWSDVKPLILDAAPKLGYDKVIITERQYNET